MMTAAAQVAAKGEYAKAKTSVWWDIENCAVPKSQNAHEIGLKLKSELMKMNYCGPLSITAYGNTNLIPISVQQALSSTGITLNHVPSGRKDASDKKILVDMLLWVLDNPAPANIMLISGDRDFSDALHKLRMRGYNILLAHPQQASVPLVASANVTWIWRSLLPSACPPTQCVVGNGSYPSQSKTTFSRSKVNGIYVEKAVNQLSQQQKTRGKKLQKSCTESVLFCKVCNVDCKSFEHLSGEEHAAQWELKQNLEMFGEPVNMVASPSECHEKVEEMTDKVVESKVEASDHCSLCSVVKIQAEVKALVDAKEIEEESVEDSEIQSRDAQQYMKCLEKELMEETCTASENSSREFLQDFKERLESDGVASVNVDCVLSELSRDFQVPKEVREWFDAILKTLETSKNELVIEELESMLNRGMEMKSGEPENAPAGPTEHQLEEDMNKKKKKRKKKTTLVEDGAVPYVCSICSFTCDHPTTFEFHVKSRKHNAKVKMHTEALLDKHIQGEIIQDIGQLKEVIEEICFQPGEAVESIDCLETQKQELREICATSEKSVEEIFQEVVVENENRFLPNAECIITELKPEYFAPEEARERTDADIIKKLELSEDATLTRELESIPDENLEMNSGDPEEKMEKKKKKDKVGKEREAYVCSSCSVNCDHPMVFQTHLMGKKHAANVKKHAEVLFDDKKILEESLKEKDHPIDALQELPFQSKEGDESIHEVCLGYESEEIQEARERFDSIVRRLELSLEETLKHNSGDNAAEEEVAEKNGKQIWWVCRRCNKMCNSKVSFDSHLTSKKHLKKHLNLLMAE